MRFFLGICLVATTAFGRFERGTIAGAIMDYTGAAMSKRL